MSSKSRTTSRKPAKKRASSPKKTPQYRSGFEKKVSAYLEKKGVEFKYEPERLRYKVPATDHVYVPDYKLPNGVYLEAKGKLDRAARKKMALVREQHPDKDIRILFMRDNTIEKRSKTRYTAWARERGYECAVSPEGHIPDDWLT